MTDTLELNLPFTGMCDSNHDSAVDSQIESMFSDADGEPCIPDDFWFHFGYNKKFMEKYGKLIVEQTQKELKEDHDIDLPSMKYADTDSPSEYNFVTDRIFITVSKLDVLRMYNEVNKGTLNNLIKKKYTSYDGFCSFYSNSLQEWSETFVTKWDHNQLGTLFQAYTDSYMIEPYELYEEIREILVDTFNPECTKIYEDFDYTTAKPC